MASRTRAMSAAALAATVTALGVLTAPPAGAAAEAMSATDQRVNTKLERRSGASALGPDLTGFVTDLSSGQVVWGHNRNERQIPASNAKLVTAVTALETFGPAHRFTTRTKRGTSWRRVHLVGAGDPSLSRADLDRLAARTADRLKERSVRRVRVLVDDHIFPRPSLAYGWKSSYVPTDIRPIRALVVNKHKRWDTSIDAGNVFAGRLEAQGIRVRSVSRERAPRGAPVLGRVSGDRLSSIVRYMLLTSDNDHAEALHRLVARGNGKRATWTGAREAQRQVLGRLGVDLGRSVLYDGSGLSRASVISAKRLVQVLSLAGSGDHPRLDMLTGTALPLAGRSGTLGSDYLRYVTDPTRCAVGLVEAKTGSLSGVITLSGYARGADGRMKAFSFLLNRVPSTLTTRRAVDKLAATVTGCW
jgi:D-alanyl-D-alanine carboxypeptidase/D-alanyl-D-alanine-endopeptidase (penicillin-binding protein 4)